MEQIISYSLQPPLPNSISSLLPLRLVGRDWNEGVLNIHTMKKPPIVDPLLIPTLSLEGVGKSWVRGIGNPDNRDGRTSSSKTFRTT